MKTIKKELDTISKEKLLKWGLYHKVVRENLIDQFILETPDPNEEEEKQLIAEWCKERKIDSEDTLKNWQEKKNISDKIWREVIIRNWRWSKWCRKKFNKDLSSYYLQRKQDLDKVTYSLLRVSKRELANELFLRIKEGESSFTEIAFNYSEGPERSTGGKVGPIAINQSHPILMRLLQVSSNGQLWAPKQLESWWIVVRLDEMHTTKFDEQTAIQLSLELGNKYLQENLDSLLKDLSS